MIKKIFYSAFLLVISQIAFAQTQIGSNVNGTSSNNRFGLSVALSSDGLTFASGAPTISPGYVKVYKLNGANWTQKGNTIFEIGPSESFGKSVALSSDGNILSVGAYTNFGNRGCVRVYFFNGTDWIQLGATINGQNSDDYFGQDVALSSDGSILAAGAYGNDTNGVDSGHIKVFKYISNTWVQLGSTVTGDMAGDRLGYSLSLSSNGNILAAGAQTNDGNGNNSGQVKIYSFDGSNWIQLGNSLFGENAGDYFGGDVSLSSNGSIVAVGAMFNSGNGSGSGHTRIYNFNGSNWVQLGLDIDGEAIGDYSGESISLSSNGTILAIGAYFNDGNGVDSGHVRIYNFDGNNWQKIGNDINGSAANDWFGNSVSLSSNGSVVCIGGLKNDSNGTDSGQVKVFDLSAILATDTFVLQNTKMYPNPVKNELHIDLQQELDLQQVNVYSVLGQFIKTEKTNIINVCSLSKGIYFVEVITDKGKATRKIMVE